MDDAFQSPGNLVTGQALLLEDNVAFGSLAIHHAHLEGRAIFENSELVQNHLAALSGRVVIGARTHDAEPALVREPPTNRLHAMWTLLVPAPTAPAGNGPKRGPADLELHANTATHWTDRRYHLLNTLRLQSG